MSHNEDTYCRVCTRIIKVGDATYAGVEHWVCHQRKVTDSVADVIKACNTLPKAHEMIRKLLMKGPFG